MSCALTNPETGICANRRPVRGRQTQLAVSAESPEPVDVAPAAAARTTTAPAAAAIREPFGVDTPEATFSLSQLREPSADVPARAAAADAMQRVRPGPPSFREIRAGRAAAAARMPVAQVRIPVAQIDDQQTLAVEAALPGMDELVARVRRRTAARIQRGGEPAAC